ncbi:unnamed protein product [Rhizoctonia solani]|uniref:Uncharacterized protein n=1 Tax=Rhizoctonia solani TaxID=456999 RepID=A0A8H3H9C4_9AGAM|nr:unnamed protein product [Rhizoctonia solani]
MSYHGPTYGPKLDEYLSLRKLGVGISRHGTEAPSEHKIEAAIDSLNNPKSVNCDTFEIILSMERPPECAYLHLLLSDVGVFPSCIRLLRTYCKEGRGILDHAYGFLCLQVMALSVEVAKLNQVEQLDVVLEELTRISTHVSPYDLLNHYSRECESNEFCKEEYLRPSPRLLGWHTDPDTRLETCLASIGGCNIQDVLFLLDQLWPARSAFLQASECAANSFPGWCGLFYVMHGTLVKAFGNFTHRRETPEEKTHWIHLLQLMLRYVICSKRSEDITLARLLRDCPGFADRYETTVTMPLDCDRIVKAYSDKMGKLPTFVYAYVVRLYEFVCVNYHVNAARSNEHLNTICASTLEESWAELLRANLLSAGQWYQFTNTIVTNSKLLMTSANHQVNKPILLSILTKEDLFDFLGRLFLFPMSVEGESIGSRGPTP